MLKRIYLFMAAICISALHLTNVMAQSCDLAPTCSELGFTQTEAECSGKKMLVCPFDRTAVFCGGDIPVCYPTDCSAYTLASCSKDSLCQSCIVGCGDTQERYRESVDYVFLKVDASTSQKLSFDSSGGDIIVDWGDGTIDNNQSHTYTENGSYNVRIGGEITDLTMKASTVNQIQILSLDLPSITSMSFYSVCHLMTGSIPSLPENLIDGTEMFRDCDKLTGSIPSLPSSLKKGNYMFYDCEKLTGSLPNLPKGLENGSNMFSNCTGITGGFPTLPDSLVIGDNMFSNLELQGSLPDLPMSLTDGRGMFSNLTHLTGSIPTLPGKLTKASSMFSGCSGITGNVPALPTGLTYATQMFYGIGGLVGNPPTKPSGLNSYAEIFAGTSVTKDGS